MKLLRQYGTGFDPRFPVMLKDFGLVVLAIYNAAAAGKKSVGPCINTAPFLPAAFLSQTYAQTVAAFGGTAPIAFAVRSAPLPSHAALEQMGLCEGTLPPRLSYFSHASLRAGCQRTRLHRVTP